MMTSTLTAQSSAVLGPHNAAFLEGLWRAGYIEQADKLGQLVAASSLPDAEKKLVDTLHTRLKIAIAARDQDATARRDLVLKLIEEKTARMKAVEPQSEEGMAVVGDLVDQYRLLADALVEGIGQEQDPEKLAALRKDADAKFQAVETDFLERKNATEKLRDEAKPGSEIPMLLAFYGLGRLQYYHCLVHPADSLHSKHKAEVALTTLQDFDLEFSDSLAAFEAKLTQALCHQRLGHLDMALAACDDAIALRSRFDKNKDGVYQVDKDAADVIAAATLQKALLLQDQKESAKVIETAKEFLTTLPHPLESMQGPGVLAAMAKAHIELGDTEAASKIAQQLVEMDPKGQWGRRGQELLGQIGSGPGKVTDVNKTLRIAETLASQGEYEQALKMTREVLANAVAPAEEKVAAEAMLITGAIFATRQWYHEASVAFDAVVRRWPKSEPAPNALWKSIQCFIELEESDHLPVYKRWIDDRSKQLVRDYPNDPRVGSLQLLEAQRLERAQNFLAASKVYEAIGADSSVYLEARYRAANCYQRHSRSLANGGQEKEAEQFSTKALAGFESVLRDIDNARLVTTDAKIKARLDQVEFGASVALASLLLSGKPRPEDAEKVIAKLKIGDDDPQAPVLWSLRIRVLLAKNAVEDAAAAMEAALTKTADAKALADTCRPLATALDNMAVERSKKNERQLATGLWRRAIAFYVKSASGATPAEVAQIAERLRIIGMIDNNIDEKVESWFEVPNFKAGAAEAWSGALQLYQGLSEADAMNYKGLIGYARVLGFQGRWNECEAELAKLFAKEKIVSNNRLDSAALSRKPELLTAYLEWGFALQLTTGGEEKARRARATDIFERTVTGAAPDGRHWWFAKFGQIQSMFDRGLYDKADVSMRSLERTNPEFDGDRYGLKVRFRTLKLAIAGKLPK